MATKPGGGLAPAIGASAPGRRRWFTSIAGIFIVLLLFCNSDVSAYSVLTHMEVVDLAWTDGIRPMLVRRFPNLSEDEITKAHAYAYGGSVIQDLGYYPFGSVEFSDLVHYVRSGDFVRELLLQSQDANEFAFALGALSHYASDVAGHPAVNMAVAIEYPKLQAKFGKSVRFAEGKTQHLKTEFGFDMVQVAKNRYASEHYHDFIGFKVSKELLERTFPVVYGVELKDVLPRLDLTIGSYRYTVSNLIPELTQIALQTHKQDIVSETSSPAKDKLLYRLSRSDYEKEWGKEYRKPGIGSRLLATMMRYIPKKGPFKAMAFKSPTPATEEMYFKSINSTVDQYRAYLEEIRVNKLVLPNFDLDSGKLTRAAEYSLADNAYAKLLLRQSDRKFDKTTSGLRTNILSFYADLTPAIETKADRMRWQSVLGALDQLKLESPGPVLANRSSN
jgi:Zinc dependent phospholipase C